MKIRICLMLLAICLIVVSCKKEKTPGMTAEPLPPIDTMLSTIKYTGNFSNGPYGTTTGKARIVQTNSIFKLRLENFNVSSGPDLKVYISREKQPMNFLRLGNLEALSGDQDYDISGMPDFMDYRYVLIHCEKYNHLFGVAELIKE